MPGIYYVLETFPKLSETFVVEEIIGLSRRGFPIEVLARLRGSDDAVHPHAQELIDNARVAYLTNAKKMEVLKALFSLFSRKPRSTLRVLHRAVTAKDRWRYFQVLPYAARAVGSDMRYVHAHFADENAWLAMRISEWADIPFGLTMHGYDVRNRPLPAEILREVIQRASALVTVSEYFKRTVSAALDIRPERIDVVNNGVDLRRFVPKNRSLHSGPCRIVNVGRLEPIKGQDILLDALHRLQAQGVLFEAVLVGDGKERHKLECMAEDLGLGDQVRFLGNQTPGGVVAVLQEADVFVMPSRDESFGVACVEAMAMELPVIASRVGGLEEIIRHGVTGLLFEVGKAAELADRIASLIESDEFRTRLGRNGRAEVNSRFSGDTCIDQLAARFMTAANAASVRRREEKPRD